MADWRAGSVAWLHERRCAALTAPPGASGTGQGSGIGASGGRVARWLLYGPKWDGYRLCALAGSGGVSLWSRQGKDLTRYLPDLQKAIEDEVPPCCVLDGEAVIWTDDRLDFDALQRRLVAAKAALPGSV